jgi:hypothetical protein
MDLPAPLCLRSASSSLRRTLRSIPSSARRLLKSIRRYRQRALSLNSRS